MAKNKNNRKQAGPKNRSSQAEQPQEHTQRAPEGHEPEMAHVPGSPADVARKQHKRFGHN
ncbi:hypothetical protein ABZX30_26055 [Streptomyces sp. NPDC004542]|uniref:hypothetical protein n=1 Tax=Streptomyces sp. NPDC004542 TaxID=3154281 RepID=UPI0033AF5997